MHLALVPLAWLTIAHAVPTGPHDAPPAPNRRSSLTIPVRANPHHVPDGPADLVAAYRKWNMPVPESLESHMLTRRAGYSSATGGAKSTDSDSYWLTEVFLGSPNAQKIPVLIDSASPDFWVMSSETDFGDAAVNGQPEVYDPSKSEVSHEVPGSSWAVEYHDGSKTSGKVYLDMLRIGLMTDYHWLNISNATVQSAVSVSNRFAIDPKLSGVLGLAKSRPSSVQPRMPTTLDRLKEELHFEVIGADLRHNSSLGFWDFGDGGHHAGDLVNEPESPESEHWDFGVTGIRMSSMTDKVWWDAKFTATVDTGSSLLLLPGDVTAKYYAEIPESSFDKTMQAYLFPCSLASGIPDMFFTTGGGYKGKVPKEYINFGSVKGNTEKCFGGIQNSATDHAIFGGVALKALYVQFNYGEKGTFVSFGDKGSDVCSFTNICQE